MSGKNFISDETARRLDDLLNRSDLPPGSSTHQRTQNRFVIVRCDSATPIGATSWQVQFWPATIVQTASDILYPPLGTIDYTVIGSGVLLTVLGDALQVVAPVADKLYCGVLCGDVDADPAASSSQLARPRVVAFDIAGGSSSPPPPPSAWKSPPVRAATTTTLPTSSYSNGSSGVGATLTGFSNGALSAQDGVTLGTGQDLLVKNEGSGFRNRIYTLTQVGDASHPFILTSRTDNDTAASLLCATVGVMEGTTQANKIYEQTTDVTIVVGSTNLAWRDVAGDVYGPSSATDGALAYFNGTTGKIISGGSVTLTASPRVVMNNLQIINFAEPAGGSAMLATIEGFGATGLGVYLAGSASVGHTPADGVLYCDILSAGTFVAAGVYKSGITTGITATKTVKDGSGTNQTVTITGGIITGWT